MRLVLALALAPAVAAGLAAALGACGGAEFVAGSGDAGPTLLDGSAGGADATPPLGAFCTYEAGTHTFCDDFDGPPLSSNWPDIETSTGSTSQDDTSIFVSAPNSFESADPRSDLATAGTTLRARLGKGFESGSQVVVNLELHLDQVGTKPLGVGGTTFLLVGFGAGAPYSVGFSSNADFINVYQDLTQADGGVTETTQQVIATPLVLGNWTKVTLTLDLDTDTATASVNGTTASLPITAPKGVAPTVYVGLSSRNVAVPVEAHFDNVTVDIVQ